VAVIIIIVVVVDVVVVVVDVVVVVVDVVVGHPANLLTRPVARSDGPMDEWLNARMDQ